MNCSTSLIGKLIRKKPSQINLGGSSGKLTRKPAHNMRLAASLKRAGSAINKKEFVVGLRRKFS